MQFIGSGWTVGGAAIALNGPGGATSVRVGDSTVAGASSTATVASELRGTSSLVKNDLGTLILTGANSYTGGTTIAAGTLRIGNGGTTGSVAGPVLANGALVFDRSNAYDFAGAISGSGTIQQEGTGLTNLTGNSSAFSGLTQVLGGTLAVNGALGGALEVQAGGRLQGAGTVGTTTVNGVIAPGNSTGTLKVAGDITFNVGSTYEVEMNAAGADRINATGTATINGGTVRVLNAPGSYGTRFTILTAGSVSGAFDGLTVATPLSTPFLSFGLSYGPNVAYLDVERSDVTFASVGQTPNEVAAGRGLDSAPSSPVAAAVAQLDAASAGSAFNQLSGVVHASTKTVLVEGGRFVRDAAIDRLRSAFDTVGAVRTPVMSYAPGGPEYVPATTDRFAVWGQAFGSWGHTEGNGNAASLSRSTTGFVLGVDAPVADSWRVGVLGGYSSSAFDVSRRVSSGSSDNYHVGVYAGTQWGGFAVRAGAAYTWHDMTTSRSVSFAGFSDSLQADYNAGTTQIFGDLGYRIDMGPIALEPFVTLTHVNLHTDGFAEHGGGAALSGRDQNMTNTYTTLGLRASTALAFGDVNVMARGSLGWRHAFGDVTPLSALSFSGGSPFDIAGVAIAKDAAVADIGLDFQLSESAVLGISYGGQFSADAVDQSVRGSFNLRF
jgi:outer membrane autotransporter protein